MPLKSIIVVFLRISSIQWVVTGLISQLTLLIIRHSWQNIALFLAYLILAMLLWAFAEPIARLVTRDHETIVPFSGLTRLDLYAFAFVYLGLSFFIGGIGSVLTKLCAILANAITEPTAHNALYTASLEQIAKASIQVILGVACLFNANRFAKKLASRE